MPKFKTALVGLTVACALAGSAPVVSAKPVVSDGPQVTTSCRYARIGPAIKCIAAGQYCSRRYQLSYLRYGYSCSKLDYRGRYHLVRRRF
jgi:hypothetical protein